MSILNGKYIYEDRHACVCTECERYADIPATIVHSPNCSQIHLGAFIDKRLASKYMGLRFETTFLERLYWLFGKNAD